MKIVVSQQGKKLLVTFGSGKVIDPSTSLRINKADDFLAAIDKFIRKRDNLKNAIAKAELEFINVGMLTERIIRATIKGLAINIKL